MPNDGLIAIEHSLDLYLRLANEHELMPDRFRCPHPEVRLARKERRRDQAPTADELVIDKAGVDFAKGLAVVKDVGIVSGQGRATEGVDEG